MESFLMVFQGLNYLIFLLLLVLLQILIFLVPHIVHFDDSIVLPLLIFKTFGFIPSAFFYALNNKITLFFT